MGTRADFYVGRGENAEWIGSLAEDGYPTAMPDHLLSATAEADFRKAVADCIASAEGGTRPDQGWPWPWADSRTTDYAYAFDGNRTWVSPFGCKWLAANDPAAYTDEDLGPKVAVFPNMKSKQKVAFGPRSGMLFVTRRPDGNVGID